MDDYKPYNPHLYNKQLKAIQTELKAPKGQYNSFGKYKYRSCEDITEAVKPLLAKHEATLTLSDELVLIGNRYYIKATAKLTSSDGPVSATAYAREPETKKGMDESQITGTASSYARKYALNGLFAIDDAKDADTDEYTRRTQTAAKSKNKASEQAPMEAPAEVEHIQEIDRESWEKLIDLCRATGITYRKLAKDIGPFKQETMTSDQYSRAMMILSRAADAQEDEK